MDDEKPRYTLDDALSSSGFGTFQRLALLFAGTGWFSEAMEMNLLSFIGLAVRSEWSLSPTEESLLSTAVFGGMLIGAYFWGFVSDSYGRRTGIRGITTVVAIAGLLSAFSPDYKSLAITRCLLGFGVAGGHVYGSWFLEFIPSSNRGAWMLSSLIFWILGQIFEAALAWVIMPRLGWRWLLGLSSTPSFLVVLFSTFIPESPRYLFVKGRISEAQNVLKRIALVNRKELPTGFLLSNLDEESSSEQTPLLSSTRKKTSSLQMIVKTISEIFSPNLLRTTLLLLFLHFGFTFASYGITLMISSLSSGQNLCGSVNTHFKNVQDTSLYCNVFITSTAGFPGFLMDRLDRKLLMTTLSMITVIVLIPLCFHQSQNVTTALLFLAHMLLFATFSSLIIYAKEVYPTSIRGSGSGLAVCGKNWWNDLPFGSSRISEGMPSNTCSYSF